MRELVESQSCPYCNRVVDECYSEWEEGTHIVECESCHKEYQVTTEYQFLGWDIQKVCPHCSESEDECYCKDHEDITD